MDIPVIASFVTAGGAVLSATVGGLFALQKNRRLKAEKEEAESDLERVGHGAIKGATYYIDEQVILLEFLENGDGRQTRDFIGIHANQNVENLRLEFAFSVPAPNGKLKPPTVRARAESKLPVTVVDPQYTDQVARGSVEIIGLLSPGVAAGFTIAQSFEKGVCTNREEAEEAYRDDKFKMEYAGLLVTGDIRLLRVTVKLPPSHKELRPPPSAIVFKGDSENIAKKETRELADKVAFVEGVAHLTIPNPTPGLQYGIAWMPPDGTR
jgi:hypothetical protein